MTLFQRLWPGHKMATISLICSVLEIVLVWGAAAAAPARGQHAVLLKLISLTWILGSLGAITFAIIALVIDRPRQVGALSLIVALAAFFFCGLQMLV
jgi:hypothetical protein